MRNRKVVGLTILFHFCKSLVEGVFCCACRTKNPIMMYDQLVTLSLFIFPRLSLCIVILRNRTVNPIHLKCSNLSLVQPLPVPYVCIRSWLINNQSSNVRRKPNPLNSDPILKKTTRWLSGLKNPISVNFFYPFENHSPNIRWKPLKSSMS